MLPALLALINQMVETVNAFIEDLENNNLQLSTVDSFSDKDVRLLNDRVSRIITYSDWERIDQEETRRSEKLETREKFVY